MKKTQDEESPLKNARHEQFAQLLAQGVNNTQAAKTVGYSERSAMSQGSRLARKAEIQSRKRVLVARQTLQASLASGLSKSWVLTELRKNYTLAAGEGQLQSANRSLELIGKQLGMFRDVHQITLADLRKMPTEQLVELLARLDMEYDDVQREEDAETETEHTH